MNNSQMSQQVEQAPGRRAPLNALAGQAKLLIKRAEYYQMPKIAEFIRSSASWYEKFVDPKDLAEHHVGQKWIDDNYFRRDFYIGYHQREPVGTISYQNMGEFAYLGYIYLDANQVGKGFGHQLMDHAQKIAIQKQKKGMILIAHPKAHWAIKAYEKYGFRCIATQKNDVIGFQNGCLKNYYEEGFYLFKFDL